MRKFSLLLLWFICLIPFDQCLAQTRYDVGFYTGTWKLYCGIANDVRLGLIDISGEEPGDWAMRAQAEGATIEFGESGRMKILPTAKNFDLKVFAERKGEIYFLGIIPCQCVPTPTGDDGAFKSEFPNPQTSLPNAKLYETNAKNIRKDANLILDFAAGLVMDLAADESMRVSIRVRHFEGEKFVGFEWNNIEISSPDAEIIKEDRVYFSIKPKNQVKRIVLTVKLNGKEIGQETMRVIKQP